MNGMSSVGDPLGDAAAEEAFAQGDIGWARLNTGIVHGLKTVPDAGAAMHAFLQDAETLPSWVEQRTLARGSEAYLSIGAIWINFSLGPGSLVHTYTSPMIAKILTATGNLTVRTGRRLQETGVWNKQAVIPGNLNVGADGYVHTLQVRMLHARVRAGLLRKGWDVGASGSPISQLDLVRTWLDFTYVPFRALTRIGITFSAEELSDLYHLWRCIAHLLGIDARLYEDITDNESAHRLLSLVDGALPPPSEDSRALTLALLETAAQPVGEVLHIPPGVALNLLHSLTRRFHGEALSNALHIRRSWTDALLPLVAAANRLQRLWPRGSATVRARAVQRTIMTFRAQIGALTGATAYQHPTDTSSTLLQTSTPSLTSDRS